MTTTILGILIIKILGRMLSVQKGIIH